MGANPEHQLCTMFPEPTIKMIKPVTSLLTSSEFNSVVSKNL